MKRLNNPIQSLAGNINLYVLPLSNIQSISGNNITIIDAEWMLHITTQRDTLAHTMEVRKTKQGTKYAHSITAMSLGRSDANEDLLKDFMPHKLYVLVLDSTGAYYGLGSMEHGLELEWDYVSGSDGSGFKGYQITLSGELLSNHLHITTIYDLEHLPVLEGIEPPPSQD